MTDRELEEYRALRDTIRERGTARVWIFVIGFGIWGGLVMATMATLLFVPVVFSILHGRAAAKKARAAAATGEAYA